MKKVIPLLILCLLLLTGCGVGYELPEGMDQDTMVAAGEDIVSLLNQGDFTSVYDQLRADVQEGIAAADIQTLYDSVVAPEGDFVRITDTMATSDTNDDTDEFYGITVIIAKHTEDDILYRMAYDTEMNLIGLSLSVS